ncbi:MAG: iron chelate uptake ABC transporter family permease subunit [Defluviitaleaceae bacterium]|nr:iron chelate uptake ABC transporter family permease subunit [Defluviitaleaceae bacterium]MCL2273852.1 iron chelate uptake ABC transporter family permease subunit [Defluviitaleaceae bacterium]
MVARLVKPRNIRIMAVLTLLLALIAGATVLYIYSRTYANANRLGLTMHPAAFESIMARIRPAMMSMIAASAVLAVVSLSFQTIVRSRVLTPSMIGFDSIFVGTQTVLVFVFGAYSVWFQNPYVNYAITAGVMILTSFLMFSFILRSSKNNVIFLLMFGLVLSGIVGSGTRYLQVIMNQSEFFHVQAATMVNVNNINTNIANIAFPIMAIVVGAILWRHRRLDVMALGPDQAKGLGIPYERELRIHLILIAVGMSVATALIGSLTFLGLLAVNAAREVLKTHKHLPLFFGSSLMAILTLVAGQAVMELLQGAVPVTVIINLVGCTYIFYLVLKENKT